jgi:hypothetical protein
MPSAYEISDVHKREPPPKEILEDVSAKGGDLLNRTVENYFRPVSREAESLANGQDKDSDDSDQDTHKTPKEDKMDIDEPGSTGGRITRGEASLYLQFMRNAFNDERFVVSQLPLPSRIFTLFRANLQTYFFQPFATHHHSESSFNQTSPILGKHVSLLAI